MYAERSPRLFGLGFFVACVCACAAFFALNRRREGHPDTTASPFTAGSITCRWLLLAGDSNTRFLLDALKRRLLHLSYRQLGAWPHENLTMSRLVRHLDPLGVPCRRKQRLPCGSCSGCSGWANPHCLRNGTPCRIGCITKFFDQERVFVNPSGTDCLAVSFKFLMAQGEMLRAVPQPNAWSTPRVCDHSAYDPNPFDHDAFHNCEQRRDWSGEVQSPCCDRWRRFEPCARHSPLRDLNDAAPGGTVAYVYPERPDFAWMSHGFWAGASGLTSLPALLPRGMAAHMSRAAAAGGEWQRGAAYGMRCAARFAPELQAIARLRCAPVKMHSPCHHSLSTSQVPSICRPPRSAHQFTTCARLHYITARVASRVCVLTRVCATCAGHAHRASGVPHVWVVGAVFNKTKVRSGAALGYWGVQAAQAAHTSVGHDGGEQWALELMICDRASHDTHCAVDALVTSW